MINEWQLAKSVLMSEEVPNSSTLCGLKDNGPERQKNHAMLLGLVPKTLFQKRQNCCANILPTPYEKIMKAAFVRIDIVILKLSSFCPIR